MKYTSTRNSNLSTNAANAILTGIAPNGGLFVPTQFPALDYTECFGLSYPETAQKVLGAFLTDYSADFIKAATESAYSEANFDGKAGFVAKSDSDTQMLELWHGPTCAFKDYALQLMPKLLVEAKKILGSTELTKILVATSGDTGKAALAGYAGLDGIKIAVFYPNAGTSEIQRLQMATQEGENVAVYAVNGNFDDAQTGVKRAFADTKLAEDLKSDNAALSSANSINWGRLAPQIVYYFYSYAQLVKTGAIMSGDKVDFIVPTGNFGDILAGYYAKQMGLPVGKLVCASNKNNVLTDFLTTGTYDAKRPFYKTTSPSMDILVSSNLERLLYHITNDSALVADLMKQLNENGKYTVSADVLAKIKETFDCGCASDEEAAQEIRECFEENGYLMDPHTAVAYYVRKHTKSDAAAQIVLSTASPYKFPCDVLKALGESVPQDEFEAMNALNAKTSMPIPQSLAQLKSKPVRFREIIETSEIIKTALKL